MPQEGHALMGRAGPHHVGPPDHGSVSWRIHCEVILLLGWGRAILMQFGHPLVARGVADHSHFRRGTSAWWHRLQGTVQVLLASTFGGRAEAVGAIRRMNRVHDSIHGELQETQGRFLVGSQYSARDPSLVAWVHATTLDSFVRAYELYVTPLSDDQKNLYCNEASWTESLFGVPPATFPQSWQELQDYIRMMLASADIAVTDTARILAAELLHPALPMIAAPLVAMARLPTIGLLPTSLRAAYGFEWGRQQHLALHGCAAVLRSVLPWVPPPVRYWKTARQAVRQAGSG